MELTAQVCSLDLAKRLEELGFKGPTVFQWRTNYNIPHCGGEHRETFLVQGESYESKGEEGGSSLTWAPTVAELGEMLPKGYLISRDTTTNVWYCRDWERLHQWVEFYGEADTMPDAVAKMLIYLVEQKLIEV